MCCERGWILTFFSEVFARPLILDGSPGIKPRLRARAASCDRYGREHSSPGDRPPQPLRDRPAPDRKLRPNGENVSASDKLAPLLLVCERLASARGPSVSLLLQLLDVARDSSVAARERGDAGAEQRAHDDASVVASRPGRARARQEALQVELPVDLSDAAAGEGELDDARLRTCLGRVMDVSRTLPARETMAIRASKRGSCRLGGEAAGCPCCGGGLGGGDCATVAAARAASGSCSRPPRSSSCCSSSSSSSSSSPSSPSPSVPGESASGQRASPCGLGLCLRGGGSGRGDGGALAASAPFSRSASARCSSPKLAALSFRSTALRHA